ncbi:MAG: type IX secretion system protein PorQ [Cyclobacteriaceae bacterium]
MRLSLVILILCSFTAKAQLSQYQFSSAADNARNAALGGEVISINDGDGALMMQNPALIDSVQNSTITLTFSPYFADINAFSGTYKFDTKKVKNLSFGIRYFDFGNFERREPNGDLVGSFDAKDYQIVIGKSHRLSSFTFGLNAKFNGSAIDNYQSTALLFDIGGIYQHPEKELTFALLFKDFGFILNDFFSLAQSKVPFDVQLGTTFKPQYMPFRFSITAYNLASRDLVFLEDEDSAKRIDDRINDIFRHISIGAELLLSQNVQFLIGYNHLRREELSILDDAGGAGMSFGLKIGVKRFQFRYAYSRYHFGGGSNFFTLQSNIRSFKKSS